MFRAKLKRPLVAFVVSAGLLAAAVPAQAGGPAVQPSIASSEVFELAAVSVDYELGTVPTVKGLNEPG